MDWKTFIAEIVRALAWPACVAFIFWSMKDNIRKLVAGLRKLKHGETEFEFEETLSVAKTEAEAAGLQPDQIPTDARLLELAEAHPSLAIIEAWQRIEAIMLQFLPPGSKQNVLFVPRTLRELGYISPDIYRLIRRLRELRSGAVHRGEYRYGAITNKSAYEYLEIAGLVQRQLESLGDVTLPEKSRVTTKSVVEDSPAEAAAKSESED